MVEVGRPSRTGCRLLIGEGGGDRGARQGADRGEGRRPEDKGGGDRGRGSETGGRGSETGEEGAETGGVVAWRSPPTCAHPCIRRWTGVLLGPVKIDIRV